MAGFSDNLHAYSDADRSPDTILGGKYRIERIIGQGAFGRVYLAFDPLLRRNVAIKELLASRTVTDHVTYEKYLERFQREARAAGRLEHSNIVGVYELAVDKKGNYYLVMQYVDGTDLRALLDQVSTLPSDRAVAIALDIAQGLEIIHEHDIVHRDLKPANIMITSRGTAKVTDFGIAQAGHESQRTQIVIGHPGTPMYMSPEQTSGLAYIDGRSDLYSLGLILYEMLVGEPYARRRQPLAQMRSDLPPPLYSIVNRLTEPDPGRRNQHASEVIADLRQLPIAPSVASTGPGPYQIPGLDHSPSGQPIWQSAPPQPLPTGPIGGIPLVYDSATIQAPPPVQSPYGHPSVGWNAIPPPNERQLIEQAGILPKQNVRVQPDSNGFPQYVVDYRSIIRKVVIRFFIALGIWICLYIPVAILQPSDGAAYTLFLLIWGFFMLIAPVVLIVMFFKLCMRAKAVAKGLQHVPLRR